MSGDDYSPESGRRADPSRVIDKIHSVLEEIGVEFDGDRPVWVGTNRGLDWNDEDDRQMVLDAFRDRKSVV